MTRYARSRPHGRPQHQSHYQSLSCNASRRWRSLWRDILPTLLMLGLVAALCLQLGHSIEQARQQRSQTIPLSLNR